MSLPGETDVNQFARLLILEDVLIPSPEPTINTLVNFKKFLVAKSFPQIISEEFAERNLANAVGKIYERCEEWRELGLEKPLHIIDQRGRIITWLHPKFEQISGEKPLSHDYCSILKMVRNATEREFLGYASLYLYALGCSRIFITDTSGDGGIDLIGSYTDGHLRNSCLFIQCKTTNNGAQLDKNALLSDYSKFLLLRKIPKWNEYLKSMNMDSSISGMSSIFIFLSNSEFKPSLRDAAIGLEILLRSSRQIAGALATLGGPSKLSAAFESLRPFAASTTKNLFSVIQKNL